MAKLAGNRPTLPVKAPAYPSGTKPDEAIQDDNGYTQITRSTATSGPGHEAKQLPSRLGPALSNPNPEIWNVTIWRFDIDLTLQMPDDEPGYRGVAPASRLRQLQRAGAIVGTYSDREPTDQRSVMATLDCRPDFCIPFFPCR